MPSFQETQEINTVKSWAEQLHTIPYNNGDVLGVMVKAMDRGIVVSEFELLSCYQVHFRTNSRGKVMKLLHPPSYGLNNTNVLQGWNWH